jgi:hypothetical protein
MYKNHFIIPYYGNKRSEVETILNNINITDNIDTIIEPFCGTSAFSYFTSLKYPKRFTYYLNDNNKLLIELYNIMKDDIKLKQFEKDINNIRKTLTKEIYDKMDKSKIETYYIHNKVLKFRPSLWCPEYKYNYIDMNKCPIIQFLKNERVIISNMDAIEFINNHCNNNNTLIFFCVAKF